MQQPFGSDITREIWGDPENVVLVYAGAAAEFALHPENHWLFYTGKLPSDPLGRLRDTLRYQQKLFFMPKDRVPLVAAQVRDLHRQVEQKRSSEDGLRRISDRAFLMVFSMLIEYGIRGYEYLNRRELSTIEKEDYFQDIRSIALLMEVKDFPADYSQYQAVRAQIVTRELQFNPHTRELLAAFRRALGPLGYWALGQFQAQFIDPLLARRLGLKTQPFFGLLYLVYPFLGFHRLLNRLAPLFFKNKTGFKLEKSLVETE